MTAHMYIHLYIHIFQSYSVGGSWQPGPALQSPFRQQRRQRLESVGPGEQKEGGCDPAQESAVQDAGTGGQGRGAEPREGGRAASNTGDKGKLQAEELQPPWLRQGLLSGGGSPGQRGRRAGAMTVRN